MKASKLYVTQFTGKLSKKALAFYEADFKASDLETDFKDGVRLLLLIGMLEGELAGKHH